MNGSEDAIPLTTPVVNKHESANSVDCPEVNGREGADFIDWSPVNGPVTSGSFPITGFPLTGLIPSPSSRQAAPHARILGVRLPYSRIPRRRTIAPSRRQAIDHDGRGFSLPLSCTIALSCGFTIALENSLTFPLVLELGLYPRSPAGAGDRCRGAVACRRAGYEPLASLDLSSDSWTTLSLAWSLCNLIDLWMARWSLAGVTRNRSAAAATSPFSRKRSTFLINAENGWVFLELTTRIVLGVRQ